MKRDPKQKTLFPESEQQDLDLDFKEYVTTDPRFVRPAEVDLLLGDASHARDQLGWEPTVSFDELITMMIEADMERLSGSTK